MKQALLAIPPAFKDALKSGFPQDKATGRIETLYRTNPDFSKYFDQFLQIFGEKHDGLSLLKVRFGSYIHDPVNVAEITFSTIELLIEVTMQLDQYGRQAETVLDAIFGPNISIDDLTPFIGPLPELGFLS